jgi:hypothetical protein
LNVVGEKALDVECADHVDATSLRPSVPRVRVRRYLGFESMRILAGSSVSVPALLLAGILSGLGAQEDLSVRIIPRFGLTSPDGYFYEEFVNFAVDEPTEWSNGSLGRAAYAGLAVELGNEDRGVFLRGELAHTFEGWMAVVHSYVKPRVLFDPPEIVYTFLDVPASITFATVQLVLPTRFDLAGIRPYGLLGGGGKWYHFGSPTEEYTVDVILPGGGFTGTFEVGGGVSFSVLGLTFDAQVRDSVNRYWGKTQHDLIFSGGLVWRVR